ncbi:hypothetical protein HT576_02365 [Haloterrigena sp. SYSU A121-1]|uniref:DUF7573 domain-containing protein n=1 Tax=Haloterrigena gelatinilytica TaxID=2741724 RepID=A0A8J8GLB4_9EURY|nr:hypothetical protein [Haloterrigena gelatinilytica]NUB89882.1 hypothetical protein [Haloterrigena gelatinilytica]
MTDDATLTDFFESEGTEDDAREDEVDANADADPDPDPDSSDADESQSGFEDGSPEQRRSADGDRKEQAADSDREQRDGTESTDGVVDVETAATDDDPIDEGPIGDTGLSTYGWGEYTCHRCASDTDRVWREDGVLVCPDCKNW